MHPLLSLIPLWLIIGGVTYHYVIQKRKPYTWGDAMSLITISCFGLCLPVAFAFGALVEAEFWDKPICKRKGKR